MEEKNNEKSLFNDAAYQIQRMNNDILMCNHYASSGLYSDWRWKLDVIWRDLSYDDKKKCEGKYRKIMFVLDKLISKAFDKGNRNLMYKFLGMKQEQLIALKDEVGKGTNWVESQDIDM